MQKLLFIGADPKTLVYHRGALLEELARRGVRITAVASQEEDCGHVRQFVEGLGGDYCTVPLARASLNPFSDLRTLLMLWKLCRKVRPDMVFSYTIKPVAYGSVAAYFAGVRRIHALVPGLGYAFTPDGTLRQRLVNLATRVFYRIALQRCRVVFLQNRDDEQLLRRERILSPLVQSHVTLGSGVNLEQFVSTPVEVPPAGELECVFVARLLKNKGILQYVAAAKRISADWPGVKFHIVGPMDPSPDGVSEEEVRSWADTDAIIYHGSLRDVRPVLRRAHVFVLPTFYREGVPRSILEALSMGRAVITTDVVGARETVALTGRGKSAGEGSEAVLEGENGFLIRPRCVDSLCQAIGMFLQRPELVAAMGQRARRLAEARFDVTKVNAGIVRHLLEGTGIPPVQGPAAGPVLAMKPLNSLHS